MTKQYKAELRDLERKLSRDEKEHQAALHKSRRGDDDILRRHRKAIKQMEKAVAKVMSCRARERAKLIKAHTPASRAITNRIALLRQRLES